MEQTSIVDDTRSFERWLAGHTRVVKADLDYKHTAMAGDPFSFMRATYYRWAKLWPEICPGPARAVQVLGVGDLHVENFGTWRDAEARLVWGINDFDEAHPVAYTNDLVRLAVSAALALRVGHLRITVKAACQAILDGYGTCIAGDGKAYVLEEDDRWLRLLAQGVLRDPVRFWARMMGLPRARAVPSEARAAMTSLLPIGPTDVTVRTRRAGLGSLGHQRFVTLGRWNWASVAREAKALVPPAVDWARPPRQPNRIYYETLLERAVRCPDPLLHVDEGWVARRLAPDCSRIELASIPRERDEVKLLRAMGWETANIHHATPAAVAAIRDDLGRQPPDWLKAATRKMAKAVTADWKDWRAARRAAAA